MNYETRATLGAIAQIIILFLLVIGILWIIFKEVPGQQEFNQFLDYNRLYLKARATTTYDYNMIISDNSIKAVKPAFYYLDNDLEVMGSLVRTYYPNDLTIKELAERLIYCESSNNPEAKNPHSTAYGYCQFLDGTWEYIQEKWDMKLDRNNPDDQLYACIRLLEEEGLEKHWQPSLNCVYEGISN